MKNSKREFLKKLGALGTGTGLIGAGSLATSCESAEKQSVKIKDQDPAIKI